MMQYQMRLRTFLLRAASFSPNKEAVSNYPNKLKASWWIPDHFVFRNEIPKTSVGKFSKKELHIIKARGQIIIPQDESREPLRKERLL